MTDPAQLWADPRLVYTVATFAVALLLATTNQLCLDVAAVPFLWVLPLSLYLLTFILCFDSDRWYVRPLFVFLLPAVLAFAVKALQVGVFFGKIDKDLLVQDAFEEPLDQRGSVLALVEGRIVLGYDLINAEHCGSSLLCCKGFTRIKLLSALTGAS